MAEASGAPGDDAPPPADEDPPPPTAPGGEGRPGIDSAVPSGPPSRPRWTSAVEGSSEPAAVGGEAMSNPLWAKLSLRRKLIKGEAGAARSDRSAEGETERKECEGVVERQFSSDILPLDSVPSEMQRLDESVSHGTNGIIDLTVENGQDEQMSDPKLNEESKQPPEDFISLGKPSRSKRERSASPPNPQVMKSDEWLRYKAPWVQRSYPQQNPFKRLHEEILDFCKWISPTDREYQMRAGLVGRMRNLVERGNIFKRYENKKVELKPFGSFVTKLYLPTSDVDMVVVGVQLDRTKKELYELERALKRAGFIETSEVIAHARVPIVKFKDRETGIPVDVCFNQTAGLEAANYVQREMELYPPLKALVLTLKFFLVMRELNETYSGGVGSFLLQMMVLAFLKYEYQESDPNWSNKWNEIGLGALLQGFFRFYSERFNYEKCGLVAKGKGGLYLKRNRSRFNEGRPYLLSIENPLDGSHDLGTNSFQIMKVRNAFSHAHLQLLNALAARRNASSILDSILAGPFASSLGCRLGQKSSHAIAAMVRSELKGDKLEQQHTGRTPLLSGISSLDGPLSRRALSNPNHPGRSTHAAERRKAKRRKKRQKAR